MQLWENRNLLQHSSSNAYNGIVPEESQAHKIPQKEEAVPVAACGWDCVYHPQAVYSIFSTYLGLQISVFLMQNRPT